MGGGTKAAVDEDTQVTDGVDLFNGHTSDRDGTARKLRLPTHVPHHLSLVGIELEPIRAHPAGNLIDAKSQTKISLDRVEIATGGHEP